MRHCIFWHRLGPGSGSFVRLCLGRGSFVLFRLSFGNGLAVLGSFWRRNEDKGSLRRWSLRYFSSRCPCTTRWAECRWHRYRDGRGSFVSFCLTLRSRLIGFCSFWRRPEEKASLGRWRLRRFSSQCRGPACRRKRHPRDHGAVKPFCQVVGQLFQVSGVAFNRGDNFARLWAWFACCCWARHRRFVVLLGSDLAAALARVLILDLAQLFPQLGDRFHGCWLRGRGLVFLLRIGRTMSY